MNFGTELKTQSGVYSGKRFDLCCELPCSQSHGPQENAVHPGVRFRNPAALRWFRMESHKDSFLLQPRCREAVACIWVCPLPAASFPRAFSSDGQRWGFAGVPSSSPGLLLYIC